jgi:hypothetical protein
LRFGQADDCEQLEDVLSDYLFDFRRAADFVSAELEADGQPTPALVVQVAVERYGSARRSA